jgi:hypothetical protein
MKARSKRNLALVAALLSSGWLTVSAAFAAELTFYPSASPMQAGSITTMRPALARSSITRSAMPLRLTARAAKY